MQKITCVSKKKGIYWNVICLKYVLHPMYSLSFAKYFMWKNWIYSCANSLSKIGYQNTTIAFFEQYDRCLKLTAGELFNFEDRPEISNYEPNQAIDQLSSDQSQLILVCAKFKSRKRFIFKVCSCFGDRCNNGSKNSAILSFRPMNLYLLLFFVLGIAGFLKKIVL